MRDAGLVCIIDTCPDIVKLNSRYTLGISDLSLIRIADRYPKLQSLILGTDCNGINNTITDA